MSHVITITIHESAAANDEEGVEAAGAGRLQVQRAFSDGDAAADGLIALADSLAEMIRPVPELDEEVEVDAEPAEDKPRKPITCGSCGEAGHSKRWCPKDPETEARREKARADMAARSKRMQHARKLAAMRGGS